MVRPYDIYEYRWQFYEPIKMRSIKSCSNPNFNTLLNIDRGVPEVWGSVYDVRDLLKATVQLRDGKKITDMDQSLIEKLALKAILKKASGTDIEKLLKEYNVI